MSKLLSRFRKEKSEHEKILEPRSLSPNPMAKEGQLAGVIAAPLVALLVAVLYIAKNYRITQEDFAMMSGFGIGIWLCFLVVIYAVSINKAAQHLLFDRVFGFTARLHPQFEIYCRPEDVRILNEKGQEIHNSEGWSKRFEELKLEKTISENVLTFFKELDDLPHYAFYFRHNAQFEGWDADKHEVPTFGSHIVFANLPFDKQFIFGIGQENWWNMILFNHPHAETDVVKVIAWALDPFLGTRMPLCILLHSSVNFKDPKLGTEQYNREKVLAQFTAFQHGVIDSQWKKIQDLEQIKEAKFKGYEDVIKLAEDKSEADIDLFNLILKPTKRHLWQKGWFQVLTFLIIVGFIAFVIAELVGWLPRLW